MDFYRFADACCLIPCLRSYLPSVIKKKALPLLIFQFGKVGSTTIHKTLTRQGINNIHFHSLDQDKYTRLVKHFIDTMSHQWQIITLVRDPVIKNISGYFQNLDNYGHPFFVGRPEEIMNANTDILIEKFHHHYRNLNHHPYDWFDEHLKATFDIDIFEIDFNQQKGWQIYENEKAKVLLIRYENLWEKGLEVIRQFVNIDNLEWVVGNKSSDKYYWSQLEAFKKKIRFSKEFLNQRYDDPRLKIFYTDKERASFRSAWLN